jgi:hypothetical protein
MRSDVSFVSLTTKSAAAVSAPSGVAEDAKRRLAAKVAVPMRATVRARMTTRA